MIHQSLPLVSVITPSYNQGKFIKETIDSVLSQDYPHIELIVIDGASTDNTLEILEHYRQTEHRFRYLSEPDRGQSHAINKGFALAKGEITGWLNSDDTYQPGAIRKAVEAFQSHPEWGMVHGNAYTIDENSIALGPYSVAPASSENLQEGCMVCQPAVFLKKEVIETVGGVDESLQFCMDYDLWIRVAKHYPIGYIHEYLANARTHATCKTSTLWATVGIREVLKTCAKHYGSISQNWLYTYFSLHRDKGITGFFQFIGEQAELGRGPKVTGMNRYEDLWVPPRFTIAVESNPELPLQKLLVRGKIMMSETLQFPENYQFRCSVLSNRQLVNNYLVGESFMLEIPIHEQTTCHEIEIYSSHYFSTGHPSRIVSFMAEEVIPLSSHQVHIYRSIADFQPLINIGSY